ncbi:peptide-N4-(N-acetyl-beta-glucosaminyl)asparagine amidase A [Oryza brachyantha]|uniref:Peptide N-acetyl-beta-D-glucosaminyl asparaginase amidase A N-terminal domain-containing protein n=1 Tax=Oryza brachyantha TaxID=4533 RepID=J3M6W2_ORYBR|nr:peptide-N4-(N-acetyl-beta-glucosaminyl)asparagine amidase A [Oryza brachyantha]
MAPLYLLLLLILPSLLAAPACAEEVPDRYAVLQAPRAAAAKEYLDPTFPLPQPPPAAPSCTVPVLSYSFGDTYGAAPAKASYAPPAGCPAPWSLVVLTFSASCAGDQYDRVAAVWLDGAELLRTTTAEPTPEGVRWTVRKDVTRYSALLRSPPGGVLSVMLENVVNDKYTGVYSVNVSLEFHGTPPYLSDAAASSSSPAGVASNDPEAPMLPDSYFQPADLIIPISDGIGNGKGGYWFRIQNASDSHSKFVTIPSSTYRAVLEVFVSPHSNDEYWYSNPPDIYIKENNLTTRRGNAAYREVVVSVDHRFVGSFVPFPVIYTGGINPLFWQPVAALGAFDLPTYDVELTPFLGLLVDSNAHEIGLSVVDGIAEWLVDANLHLWLDPSTSDVHAALGSYQTPRLKISRQYSTRLLEGRFKIKAKRRSSFSGWVKSSFGNFTTEVETELKATSLVEFTGDGKNKTVSLEAKQETKTLIRADTRKVIGKVEREAKYPLSLFTETEDGENGTSLITVTLSHGLSVETETETRAFESKEKLDDRQTAEGWMVVMDHDVVNGSVATTQAYRFSDEDREYERTIDVMDGAVLSDNVTESFSALAGAGAADACWRCRGRSCDGAGAAACRVHAGIAALQGPDQD